MPDPTPGGEFAAIQRLRRRLPAIGDDCAVVEDGRLLAIDAVVQGVHFDLATATLVDVGWKALVANVSDIAAMGGRPQHALAAVVGPSSTDLDALYDGMLAAAEEYECEVVGGDLANGPVVMVAVAITGAVTDGEPVLRSGARPGDTIYVTGALGHAAASGWRERPRAHVEEGEAARRAGATAMIDVSDGLAADVGHLAEASGVGVVLDDVPVADGATLDQAMGGGEDYELVFTGVDLPVGIAIGHCTDDPSQRPPATGWEHQWA